MRIDGLKHVETMNHLQFPISFPSHTFLTRGAQVGERELSDGSSMTGLVPASKSLPLQYRNAKRYGKAMVSQGIQRKLIYQWWVFHMLMTGGADQGKIAARDATQIKPELFCRISKDGQNSSAVFLRLRCR